MICHSMSTSLYLNKVNCQLIENKFTHLQLPTATASHQNAATVHKYSFDLKKGLIYVVLIILINLNFCLFTFRFKYHWIHS